MSSPRQEPKNYTDFDLEFSANSLTEDIKSRNGLSSIAQSVRNILMTYPGERPFSPMGGGIMDFLFEPDNPATLYSLRERVYGLILKYEPRIKVQFNDISSERLSNSSLRINIKYRLADNLEMGNLQNLSLIVSGE
jgi:phage baseplate assembly protein W